MQVHCPFCTKNPLNSFKCSLNTLALKLVSQSGFLAKNLGQGRLPAFQLGFVLSDVYHSNAWERKNKWSIDIFMNITMEVLYNSKILIHIVLCKVRKGYHHRKAKKWPFSFFLVQCLGSRQNNQGQKGCKGPTGTRLISAEPRIPAPPHSPLHTTTIVPTTCTELPSPPPLLLLLLVTHPPPPPPHLLLHVHLLLLLPLHPLVPLLDSPMSTTPPLLLITTSSPSARHKARLFPDSPEKMESTSEFGIFAPQRENLGADAKPSQSYSCAYFPSEVVMSAFEQTPTTNRKSNTKDFQNRIWGTKWPTSHKKIFRIYWKTDPSLSKIAKLVKKPKFLFEGIRGEGKIESAT